MDTDFLSADQYSTGRSNICGSKREQRVNRAKMARRLHWNFERVARTLNPHHDSKMGTMETAFSALGLEVDVQLMKAS